METVAAFLLLVGLGGLAIYMMMLVLHIAYIAFRDREWVIGSFFSLVFITLLGGILNAFA